MGSATCEKWNEVWCEYCAYLDAGNSREAGGQSLKEAGGDALRGVSRGRHASAQDLKQGSSTVPVTLGNELRGLEQKVAQLHECAGGAGEIRVVTIRRGGLRARARDGRGDGRGDARRDDFRRLTRGGGWVGTDRAKHFMKGGRELMVEVVIKVEVLQTMTTSETVVGTVTVLITDVARHRLHPRTCRVRWLTRSSLCTGYIGAQLSL